MDYMDEFDPDWAGDPRISTLKRKSFQAERDIATVKKDLTTESAVRAHENFANITDIKNIISSIKRIVKENSISNLYFQDKISKEEAKRLWELYQSPDEENHRVADSAIEELTKK